MLAAVAPQLDGDDFAQCPAAALGSRPARVADVEVSLVLVF
jgi:hypothetical protein